MVSRFISLWLGIVTFALSTEAFCPQYPLSARNVATYMSDEPSDTSSDPFPMEEPDVVTVQSQEVVSATGAVVSDVFDSIPTALGEVSETDRAMINEVLLKLEALNPTIEPARSPLLNGEWELRYSGGYSSEGALRSPTRQVALFLYSGGYRYVSERRATLSTIFLLQLS